MKPFFSEDTLQNNGTAAGCLKKLHIAGADPGFRVRGAHLKKLRRAEGCAKIFVVFRVKNHDFTPKNHILSNFRGARAGCPPSPPSPVSTPV